MKKKLLEIFFVLFRLLGAGIVGAAAGKTLFQVRYFSSLPNYEIPSDITCAQYCPLCECGPTNSPCLVNLNTGTVSVIRLYDPHRTIGNKISDKTDYGVMISGWAGEGAHYYSFPDNHYTDISFQKEKLYKYSATAASNFFCANCVEEITAIEPNCGFLFADCYDKENVQLYRLEDAEEGIEIRHYKIIVDEKNELYLHLKMTSSYFTGNGKALDY